MSSKFLSGSDLRSVKDLIQKKNAIDQDISQLEQRIADVSERVLISVSRYKQNRNCRIFQLDLARDFKATHARHCEIEQYQFDLGLPFLEEIKRSATTASLKHDITKVFQDQSCDFAYRAVVIHE